MSILPNESLVRMNESESLNLTCVVDSYPNEYPSWRKSSQTELSQYRMIRSSNQHSITSTSYVLSSIKRSDNGTYYCFLRDNAEISMKIDLIVQSKHFLTLNLLNFQKFYSFFSSHKGRPSLPKILNSSYLGKSMELFLKWTLDDEGDLKIRELSIEIFEFNLNKTMTIGIFN